MAATRANLAVTAGFACLLAAAPARCEEPLAAHITGFDALLSTEIQITRKHRPVQVSFERPLRRGDQIRVLGAKGAVRLRYLDGRETEVTLLNSPYNVTASAAPRTPAGNYAYLVWEQVTRHHDEGVASTGMRGGGGVSVEPLRLMIPGLGGGEAQLPSGGRPLIVGWAGGQPPYSVQVETAAGDVKVDEKQILARRLIVVSHPVVLQPGILRLVVTDAAGAVASGRFTVIANTEASAASLEEAAEVSAAKIAVAPQRNGFAAYEALAPGVAAGWAPAVALAEWLEAGGATPAARMPTKRLQSIVRLTGGTKE